MKTEYSIIWVDDDKESVDDDRLDVEEFLAEFGILAKINMIEADGKKDIHDRLTKPLDNPDLDLLVIDLAMPGMSGGELIRRIRETDNVYIPVVFYSQDGVEALKRAVVQDDLDGAYFSDRMNLVGKLKLVIKSLLAKEQTVKRARGLLMEGVSEIDVNFAKIFLGVWGKLGGDQKRLVKKVKDVWKERSKSATKFFESFPDEPDEFFKHMQDFLISPKYDTNTRWRVVKNCLEFAGYSEEQIKILKEFENREDGQTALMHLRNNYAHKTRVELEDDHNEETCRDIRVELRRQSENLKGIVRNL